MNLRAIASFAAALLICLIPVSGLALEPYSQNFEALFQPDTAALSDDGWVVFGNVSSSDGGYLYGYGTFPAPNNGSGFCEIDAGQGGDEQGIQQLVVYSDYNNVDHALGHLIESNVFQEQTITADDVGKTFVFSFHAKLGNIAGASTAQAFIKTLDPSSGWAMTNYVSEDMTAIPVTWGGYALSLTIDASLVDQIFQFGFLNVATMYESSGIFYDNIVFEEDDTVGVPDSLQMVGAKLAQNWPNPFNPSTEIGFALNRPESVDVSVFDLSGRRVATLFQGHLEAGSHQITWNGTADNGQPVSTGQYHYVLKTSAGQVSRSMTLLK